MMEQNLHTAETYDFRQYDRLWQRVAPGLEPYPAEQGTPAAANMPAVQETSGRPDAASVRSPTQLRQESQLPGAEENPCCMGTAAAEMLQVLTGFVEQELEDLSASGNAPREMPAYDNLQAVMVELNSILADSQEYTLRFASADGEETVAERRVTLPFTCADYDTAKGILRRLHDSDLRCQLEDVSLSQGENGAVQVTASLIFYEYREK